MKKPEVSNNQTLDQKDKQILRELHTDPRQSVADISRKTGIRRDTVMYRIKRLEERNLIHSYHLILNPDALGLSHFIGVLIKTIPATSSLTESFEHQVAQLPNVTHIMKFMGRYNYMILIAAGSVQESNTVLDTIKAIHHDFITDVEVMNLVDEPKIDDFSALVDLL